MKQQEGEGFSSKKDLLLFFFYLNDMCFRHKSCCHFLKLRNHLLYALLSYGCALTTNNSPILQLCVTICCASLSRLHIKFHTFTCKFLCKMKSAYACTFFVPSFQGLEKNSSGGERKPRYGRDFPHPALLR